MLIAAAAGVWLNGLCASLRCHAGFQSGSAPAAAAAFARTRALRAGDAPAYGRARRFAATRPLALRARAGTSAAVSAVTRSGAVAMGDVHVRYDPLDPGGAVEVSLMLEGKEVTLQRQGDDPIANTRESTMEGKEVTLQQQGDDPIANTQEVTLQQQGDYAIINTLKRLSLTVAKKMTKAKGARRPPAQGVGAFAPPAEPSGLVDASGAAIDIAGLKNAGGWERLFTAATAAAAAPSAVANGGGSGGGAVVMIKLPCDAAARRVLYNPPTIRGITCALQGPPMVGHPLIAVCESESADAVEYEWVRYSPAQLPAKKGKSSAPAAAPTAAATAEAVIVGRAKAYVPVAEDIGKRLRVRATPVAAAGSVRGRTCTHAVPEHLRSAVRCCFARYCTSDFAANVLYPYCPAEWRDLGHRSQVVVRELLGYSADVICLQECDRKVFYGVLLPTFKANGYDGLYKCKCGAVPEGAATFWDASKLEMESSHDFNMRDVVPKLKEFQLLWEEVPHLLNILARNLSTIGQITVLRTKGAGGRRIIVANTHLFFHPNAAHIRLIQMVALMNAVQGIRERLLSEGQEVGVVVCGDMNSTPLTAIRYLEGDTLSAEHAVWRHVRAFRWGERYFKSAKAKVAAEDGSGSSEEAAAAAAAAAAEETAELLAHAPAAGEELLLPDEEGGDAPLEDDDEGGPVSAIPTVALPLPLTNASGYPPYTNFTPAFTDTLDYIFADTDSFEAVSSAPVPPEAELRAITVGLPYRGYPSDHVAVVADIRYRNPWEGDQDAPPPPPAPP
ncbi:Endonuclease/exonuclease/phosphatase [Tribonema minus]|uniref:Endonuclease/exonuclease/phosphatase n=1 Tax=Tribonema minus TaxID=303371 RepID=A0A836CIF3_9STRA|nr:Endonuclease/exonuclease/phosphatase [Tribonema minus]